MRAFFDERADLAALLACLQEQFGPESIVEIRREQPASVPDSFEDWDPICVGRQFWIAPSSTTQAAPAGRIRLAIDNSRAFGSGRHESTQLALAALEEQAGRLATVLDIGCGSGILSEAALLLGARDVYACDIQEDALDSIEGQLRSRLFAGSVDAIRSHTGDLVFANISAQVIDRLAWELSRATKPDGRLVLAGFIAERVPRFFAPEKVSQLGDWLCWICRPQSLAAEALPLRSHVHDLNWW